MTRFNYLPTREKRRFSAGAPLVAIDDRIRGPLVALVLTLLVVMAANVAQLARLHAAHAAYLSARAQAAADEPALRAVALLRARVIAAARRSDRVALLRRGSLGRADELVYIGNRLPAGTWLERVQYDGGDYVLEGGAERIADVGTALLTLRDPDRVPQLVWLHTGSASGDRVRYRLRLRQRS